MKRFGHEAYENETDMETTLTTLIDQRHTEQLTLIRQQQKRIERESKCASITVVDERNKTRSEKKKMLERVAAIDQENMDLIGQMASVVWERNSAVGERDEYKAKYEKVIRGVEQYTAHNDSIDSVEVID